MEVPAPSELNQTPAPEFTIESLLAPEGVETLIASGRVPGLMELRSPMGKAFCLIPPEGTQIGDHITHGAGVGVGDQGAVVFESPDGQNRGMATIYEISEEQAQELIERIKEALERMR